MANESLLVGCCGWSEARARYFQDFQTVEIQSTFYEMPSVALAGKWRASAPESFQFCMKAWQLITHAASSPTYRKLKSKLGAAERDLVGSFQDTEQVMLAWERTADVARALTASIVLFQCPASFRPEPANLQNLRRFFGRIKRENIALAWEPRGAWPPGLAIGLCQDLDLLLCVDPLQSDLAVPEAAPYWRLHGRGGYSYRYSDDDLEELARLASRCIMDQGSRYIFFNNIWMKDDALRFKRLLKST